MQRREHQVACQRGLDGDLRGFLVADLTHHDDVGRLPQHRAQPGREGQPNGGLDEHLVDARKLILNWILDGNELAIRLVQQHHRPVEGCGLS